MTARKNMFKDKSREELVSELVTLKAKFTSLKREHTILESRYNNVVEELSRLQEIKADFNNKLRIEIALRTEELNKKYMEFAIRLLDRISEDRRSETKDRDNIL